LAAIESKGVRMRRLVTRSAACLLPPGPGRITIDLISGEGTILAAEKWAADVVRRARWVIPAAGVIAALLLGGAARPASGAAEGPEYNSSGQMLRPAYREWVFLSSGLGMTYGPLASANPRFDNVFASPAAYQAFLETGRWPEKTVLVLEVRNAQSKGSINTAGNFQTEIAGVEAHVKDSGRFPGGWAFFQFGRDKAAADPTARTANCFTCHEGEGAVDSTFVQFYPTLMEVAKKKGTYK
jgi:hypothetical protein